ncbi:MAG TPA: head GIN domain-containing protein [Rectinemataceae bacterium]|nr:head GIN domain-containing protein [Rectinemataceae bacterium]
MKRAIFSLLFLALLSSSCVIAIAPGDYVGNGKVVTTALPVSGYSVVKNMTSGQVRLRMGPSRSASVRIDENLVEYLDIHTDNDALIIALRPGKSLYRYTEFTVDVTLPSLNEIGVYGSGNISVLNRFSGRSIVMTDQGSGVISGDFEYDHITASILGSGNIKLSGSSDRLDIKIYGSGSVQAPGFTAGEAVVAVNGSGSCTLRVLDSLDARIFGSGSVYYYGYPSISITDFGSGDVKQILR